MPFPERHPRFGRATQRAPEPQLSFLAPDDAALVHLLRRFVAEAARIYESKTGQPVEEALTVHSPKDAYEFLRAEMEGLEQEQLRVINLDTRNRVISAHMIYQGTLNCSHARIGEVFRPALLDNAACVILAHNHPSGDVSASPVIWRKKSNCQENSSLGNCLFSIYGIIMFKASITIGDGRCRDRSIGR